MKHDGLNFVRNSNFGWRMSNPDVDVDLDGHPVQNNYVSFVRIGDCKIVEKEGKSFYDPKEAPSIPVAHGGTYYGFGKWKKRKSTQGVWLLDKNSEEVLAYEYWQCTVYLVNDARVYTTSLKRVENPKD